MDDFIDEAKFTQTHRIVLGLSGQNLEQEIIFHPEDIDAQDTMGRTLLAWAAARGDRRAIVTLLSHGANPNIIDVQLSGPVSNAASQGHTLSVFGCFLKPVHIPIHPNLAVLRRVALLSTVLFGILQIFYCSRAFLILALMSSRMEWMTTLR